MSTQEHSRIRRVAQAVLDQKIVVQRELETGVQRRIEFSEEKLQSLEQLLFEQIKEADKSS